MTPPSTCGLHKRVRFSTAEVIDTNGYANLRHCTKGREGESPKGFFQGLQEGSEKGCKGNDW